MLREAYVAGRLDLDELCDRAEAAYSARTRGDLCALTADLTPAAGVTGRAGSEAAAGLAGRASPGAARLAAPVLLLALGCLAAAVWQPAAIVPLIILSLTVLAAAGWSACCPLGQCRRPARPYSLEDR